MWCLSNNRHSENLETLEMHNSHQVKLWTRGRAFSPRKRLLVLRVTRPQEKYFTHPLKQSQCHCVPQIIDIRVFGALTLFQDYFLFLLFLHFRMRLLICVCMYRKQVTYVLILERLAAESLPWISGKDWVFSSLTLLKIRKLLKLHRIYFYCLGHKPVGPGLNTKVWVSDVPRELMFWMLIL